MRARKRRAYLEYFHKNAAGEYVYAGGLYTFEGGEKARKCALTVLWTLLGAAAGLTVLGSFLPVPGLTHVWYVLVPYVLSVIAVFADLWSLGEITVGGEPLREYVHDRAVKRLKLRSFLTAVSAGLACLGEGIYLLRDGALTTAAGVFLGWEAATVAAGAAAFVLGSRLRWRKMSED